jgi:hypothetical protein
MAYPNSDRLFNLTELAGGQAPGDLLYLLDVSAGTDAGDQSDRKQSLNDTFDTITKNVSNLSIQWADGDSVSTLSGASAGRLRYSASAASSTGSFQVSEAAAAFQNLIKGPASAGNLTANLLPFATAGDVIGDTAWCQLGTTTSRTTNFNASTPGTALTSYGSIRVGVFDPGGFTTLGLIAIAPSIKGIFNAGTLASPVAAGAGNTILSIIAGGQYSTTAGQINNGATIKVYATAAWSASEGGTSLEILTNKEGVAVNNAVSRLLINQLGCFHVAPTVTAGESSTGTNTLFQVAGNAATIDNLAVSFFCDLSSGGGTHKTIVAQRVAAQTGAILETQSATGVTQWTITPQLGTECHFMTWAGSTNVPAISAAAQARLFIDADGNLLRSQGQSAWGVVCGYEINTQVADYSVKVGDTGTFFSNQGALGTVIFTLPAIPSGTGSAGVVYVFYARTNQTIILQLPASTVLRNGSSASSAAGTATSTAQFDLIRIVGTRDSTGFNPEYVVESVRGTWTLA